MTKNHNREFLLRENFFAGKKFRKKYPEIKSRNIIGTVASII